MIEKGSGNLIEESIIASHDQINPNEKGVSGRRRRKICSKNTPFQLLRRKEENTFRSRLEL